MKKNDNPLREEFLFFQEHKDEFIREHANQFVVLVDHKVLGFFNTIAEAINEAMKEHKPGKFFVEFLTPDSSYYNLSLMHLYA